jgi:hypothetical protein
VNARWTVNRLRPVAAQRRRTAEQRAVQGTQLARQDRVADHRVGEQRQAGPAPGDVAEHAADQLRTDVDHPVGEAELVAGLAVVRIVGVEGHDHPSGAGVRRPPAAEGLHALIGDAEGIRLVAVPVIGVPLEVGMHRLQRLVGRAPVARPV